MIPSSSLSSAAYSLRELLGSEIADLDGINDIRIGHPADNIKELVDAERNCLNLFFYDVNYDGYPADGNSDNPFYVRLYCLITAIGHKTDVNGSNNTDNDRDVSKGENELRLIGEVMRILHEQPLLAIGDAEGNEIAVLQVIPHAMNLDNLNHIWSTQTDISYRLSVAYEMALAPVPQALPEETSPLVGDSRMVVWGDLSREAGSETDGIISQQPQVEYLEVDTTVDSWVPHICCVETLPDNVRKLHYVFKVEGGLDDDLNIVIAGKGGGEVQLYWNIWRRNEDNSVLAWKEDVAAVENNEGITLREPTGPPDTFAPGIIDPDNIHSKSIFQVSLPKVLIPDDDDGDDGTNTNKAWQAVLYAVHEWSHEDPAGSGRSVTTPIKSNTVLFYGGTS